MTAVAWTLTGLLGAAVFALAANSISSTHQLGARIDTMGASLSERIDTMGASLGERIDTMGARLDARIDAMGARLDARIDANTLELVRLSERLNDHLSRH